MVSIHKQSLLQFFDPHCGLGHGKPTCVITVKHVKADSNGKPTLQGL